MVLRSVRLGLIVVGVIVAWHGISLLLDMSFPDLRSVAFWFAGGIIVHDGLFAPLCLALGFGGRRVLPQHWWGPVGCGAVCTVALLALSIPVIGRRGAVADNPSILDRNYVLGLAIALLVVWAVVVAELVRRHNRGERDTCSNARGVARGTVDGRRTGDS